MGITVDEAVDLCLLTLDDRPKVPISMFMAGLAITPEEGQDDMLRFAVKEYSAKEILEYADNTIKVTKHIFGE